jgi:1-deoxy-D-xylulose-5-phosphate synthase
MYTSQLETTTSPFVIRYPRGEGVMPEWKADFTEIGIGKGRKMKDGDTIAILSFGHPGNFAAQAIRNLRTYGINPAHYDMRFVKPLDEELLHEVFSKYSKIITVEDGTIIGGFGSAIVEFMASHNYHAELKMLGIPDRLVEHGTLKELHRECGYDAQAIEELAREMMNVKVALHQ